MRRLGLYLVLALLLAGGTAAQPYDLDGYTAQRFALQRLEIVDRAGMAPASLIVPAGWTSDRDAKDNLRLKACNPLGEMAESLLAQVKVPTGKRNGAHLLKRDEGLSIVTSAASSSP